MKEDEADIKRPKHYPKGMLGKITDTGWYEVFCESDISHDPHFLPVGDIVKNKAKVTCDNCKKSFDKQEA